VVSKANNAEVPACNTKQCQNCGFDLEGTFCGRCGQPEQSMIRFFGAVIMHYLDDIFGFDSRAGRTLFPLVFRPGFLTNEYFRGRRVHYVPPLRLYFFISIIFFITLGFFTDDSVDELVKLQQDESQSIQLLNKQIGDLQNIMVAPDYKTTKVDQDKLDGLIGQRTDKHQEVNESIGSLQEDIDEIKMLQKDADSQLQPEDIIKLNALEASISLLNLSLGDNPRQYQIAKLQSQLSKLKTQQSLPNAQQNEKLYEQKAELETKLTELLAGKELTDEDMKENKSITVNLLTDEFDFLSKEQNAKLAIFMAEMEEKAKKAFKQDAGPLIKQILSVLPQAMFILLPIFALMLKLFYLFSKRYYMEHLTVALHSHAFLFVVLMLAAALPVLDSSLGANYSSFIETVSICLAIWVPLYLFIMQKKVYKQGLFITCVKFCLIGISYIILLSFTIFIAFFWGLAKL
jgi:hypothetical protein